MSRGFKLGDFLAIGAVLLLAAVIFAAFLFPGKEPVGIAQVYQNGKLVKTVSLNQDQEFTVEGNYCNTVTVTGGSIAITEADCPGEDCVHSGSIRSVGRSLVCLPNAVEIRVVSGESDVDFVVG